MAIDNSDLNQLLSRSMFYITVDFNNEDDLVMLQNIINKIKNGN